MEKKYLDFFHNGIILSIRRSQNWGAIPYVTFFHAKVDTFKALIGPFISPKKELRIREKSQIVVFVEISKLWPIIICEASNIRANMQ